MTTSWLAPVQKGRRFLAAEPRGEEVPGMLALP